MRVNKSDGSCRSGGGELEIIDADDTTMTVQCKGCGEDYPVETDAFNDGGMIYHLDFLMARLRGGAP